jgi:tetratricopeptide (TPR) repeat protein
VRAEHHLLIMDRTPSPSRAVTADMLPKLYDVGEQSILINRLDEAAWCFERAAEFDPASARPLKGLAKIRQLQGRPAEARRIMAQAIAMGETTADTYTVLGQICQAEGDFSAAEDAFAHAIAIDPTHGPAHLRRALLGDAASPAARIAELEHIAGRPGLSADQQATLHFALGREYERAAAYDAAFAAYARANAVRHAQYPGYSDSFSSADPSIAVFDAAFLAARAGFGDASARPVFVVGMMRSGTTLIEQILASHPEVHGHGELSELRQIYGAIRAAAPGQAYPPCLAGLDRAGALRYARQYLARLEREAPNASRSIDKLPHNFEQLGLIALLFPNARVIHCTRDRLDVCVSNYFQDFGPLNLFTYDLPTLGRYWREYDRLMRHWEAVLPLSILRVPYEALVADSEGWSRRAVEFLGLRWDAACLQFHSNPRPVFTKSLWQVRQPIYRSSIGRWRHYERHLGALGQ